jgi:hypothetical protein
MKLPQWLATSPVLELPRRVVWKLIIKALETKNMTVAPAASYVQRKEALALIKQVIAEKDMLLTQEEAYQLYSCVLHSAKIPGGMAELGVYRGGSAKIICEAKAAKPLHLFDTFEGLPELEKPDTRFEGGQYKSSRDEVTEYLKGHSQVFIHQGLFPATAIQIHDERFSFVHLDADTFPSITAGLSFFYPRMNAGGLILIHDYAWAPGVRDAVEQFLEDKIEPLIELAGSYCGIVKIA